MQANILLPIKGELREMLHMRAEDAALSLLSTERADDLKKLALKGMALPTFTVRIMIGSNIIAKIGPSINLDEARNLDYIHARIANFPAPRCLGAVTMEGITYLFMTREEGGHLEYIWTSLSTSSKSSLQNQLEESLQRLRLLESESRSISFGNCATRISKDMRRFGRENTAPIRTEEDFNEFLFTHPRRTASSKIQMLRDSMRNDHRIKLTHGGLHPRHILVTWDTDDQQQILQESVRISSILGWDMAGWYPEYWEFIKAMHLTEHKGQLKDWVEYLPTGSMGVWAEEYAADMMLSEWIG